MKTIQREKLNDLLGQIDDSIALSNTIVPWTWLGDDFHRNLPDGANHEWPKVNMAGYCLPFNRNITFKEDGEQYWPSFVAYYSDYSNAVVESSELSYGLYLEGEHDHFYAVLSGWSIGRRHGSYEHNAGLVTGTVDYDGNLLFERYERIYDLMYYFSKELMMRELHRGDPYLASFATHHHNEVYTASPYSNAVREIILPVGRPLKQLIWGE